MTRRVAADLDPDRLLEHARKQRDTRRLREAEESCRLALAIRDSDADAHLLLGTILRAQDRSAAALASFEQAVRLDPGSAEGHKQLAVGLAEAGRLSEAIAADRTALTLSPDYIGAWYHLAQLKTFTPSDPDLAALEALAANEGLEQHELIALLFALAKVYDDLGEHERSFGFLHRANALKRGSLEYDVEEDVRNLEQTAAVFQAELFDELADAGSPSDLPILIVGMPRSGTTLVEQILASHPSVHGGGELQHLAELVAAVGLLSESGLEFPDGVPQLRFEDLRRLGHGYAERLRQHAPDAGRVTDKQPLNFRYLGVARLIVPQARVIHCVRDPIDTCLSCYKVHFESLAFACDLDELGRYYRAYERLMAHWRSVLPNDWMLEISYEDVVDDLEREARRIVAHCGLPWDDSCVAFHETQRNVQTASFAQVRRPVYRDSVARWRRYERHLGPLFAALDPGTHGTNALFR